MKINSHCWLRTALQPLQCICIILWQYSNKRQTEAAVLIRGRRLFGGSAYSSKYGILLTSCLLRSSRFMLSKMPLSLTCGRGAYHERPLNRSFYLKIPLRILYAKDC